MRYVEFTAAGTVPDFHRIPFSAGDGLFLPRHLNPMQEYHE
jgi:hypothetical protein